MKQVIILERIYLREFVIDDVYKLCELENNDQVTKYVPGSRKITLAEGKKRIIKYIESYSNNSLGIWPVIIKDTGKFAGITGYRYLNDIKKTEIGIKLFPDCWGLGYATEIGKALIKYGFDNTSLNEIVAMAKPENIKSTKSLENIGMKFYKYGYYKGSKVVYYVAFK